jgi:hypothetical protein
MAVARVGDKAFCPKHKGAFPIVTGDPTFIVDGQALARHGDALACGCKVLAVKQSTVSVESGGGGGAKGESPAAAQLAALVPSSPGVRVTPMSLLEKEPVCEECLMAGNRSGSVFLSR